MTDLSISDEQLEFFKPIYIGMQEAKDLILKNKNEFKSNPLST
jgi:hypothetical protein